MMGYVSRKQAPSALGCEHKAEGIAQSKLVLFTVLTEVLPLAIA